VPSAATTPFHCSRKGHLLNLHASTQSIEADGYLYCSTAKVAMKLYEIKGLAHKLPTLKGARSRMPGCYGSIRLHMVIMVTPFTTVDRITGPLSARQWRKKRSPKPLNIFAHRL
jgi:hypothetical protein